MKRIALILSVLLLICTRALGQGGPVILMGIDAEDGGIGGHGPIGTYEAVVSSLLTKVDNGGSGVLVIGGGKNAADNVTVFWDRISTDTGIPVTYVNGDVAIAAQSFAGFAIIAVISDSNDTPSGGLTALEHAAINARKDDITAHVNGGGGIFGLSSQNPDPYGYISGIGADCAGNSPFTFAFPAQYDNITATAEGTAVGITDALDICCWHDEYLTFPSFLQVLASNNATGHAAAIGGDSVFIPTGLDCPKDVTAECAGPNGTEVKLTAHVEDAGCTDITVTWEVDGVIVQTDPLSGQPIKADVSLTHSYTLGSHTVKITTSDGETVLRECKVSVTIADTTPPVIACPDNITVKTDKGLCSAVVGYRVSASDSCDGSAVTVICVPASGSIFPKGTTKVECTATDAAGNTATCIFTVTVVDGEAPLATCTPTTNPAGKQIPTAGTNPKSGQNPDGFYQLAATDNCDASPKIYVADSGSSFIAGPFKNKDKIKITQAPGVTPNQKPMAGEIVAHCQFKGDAVCYAVDAAGNKSIIGACLVPPPPK